MMFQIQDYNPDGTFTPVQAIPLPGPVEEEDPYIKIRELFIRRDYERIDCGDGISVFRRRERRPRYGMAPSV